MASEEKSITTYKSGQATVKLSSGIVRKMLTSGEGKPTEEEVILFITQCQHLKLNPFLREIYLIKYSQTDPATIVLGKDAFLKRAEANEKYDGATAGVYIKDIDGKLEKRTGTLVLDGEELVGGWATVYRKDRKYPVEISVSFKEYVGMKKNGEVNRQWKRMPATMIRKVPLVQAHRESFPTLLSDLYDESEISSQFANSEAKEGFDYKVENDEKPKEKSEEYKKIEEQIFQDIKNPLFAGTVILDEKEVDLDYYKIEIPKRLESKVASLRKLQDTADVVARMLLVAEENAKNNQDVDEKLGDDELFDKKLEDVSK